MYNESLALQTESYNFVSKIKTFEETVGGLVEMLDQQAKKIEEVKLQAVGTRNKAEGEAETRKKKQQELQFLINEKLGELERYAYQLDSLTKVETEQKLLIEKLRNNEA